MHLVACCALARPHAALALLLAVGTTGCPDTTTDDDGPPGPQDDDGSDDDDDDSADTETRPCSETFNVEVVPLDIWGLDLAQASVEVRAGELVLGSWADHTGAVRVGHDQAAEFAVEIVESGEFVPASATLVWDGGSLPGGLALVQPGESTGARAVHSYEVRHEDGRTCPTATVFLGLDHRWFAATGRPAREGNDLTLLLNGQDAWASLYDDLVATEHRIHHSVWYWVSDFELIRDDDHMYASESERRLNTAMTLLENQPVTKRLLVNRFYEGWDWIDILYTEADLLGHAEWAGDDFEVILNANETDVPLESEYDGEPADFCFRDRVVANPLYADAPLLDPPCHGVPRDLEIPAASWHQNFWLFDDQVAYVTGMNTKSVDWDTHDHLVFDHRRMEFDASTEERLEVYNHWELPDFGPRRDYMIRIDGPLVTDVDDVFHTRWECARLTDAAYSEYTTEFQPQPYGGSGQGTLFAQLQATMPEPWAEMSILESQLKALANAESYIFIEDQYWRATRINEAIINTLAERPWVKLIVISKTVADYDGGAKYTYLTDQMFREIFPDQYLYLQLKTFEVVAEEGMFWDTRDLYFDAIDTHSKIMIVDDRYLSVGSANKNNRALLYDGELNVAVLDDVWVRDQRQWLFENLVGPDRASQVSDDPDANFELFAETARVNEELETAWGDWIDTLEVDVILDLAEDFRPDGYLYTLEQSDNYWWDIGPDMF